MGLRSLSLGLAFVAALSAMSPVFADDLERDAMTARTIDHFMASCVKTLPDFVGIESLLKTRGFKLESKGIWKDADMQIKPDQKLKSGAKACSVFRYNIDPVETADLAVKSLSHLKVQNLKATRKGRRTFVTFTKSGQIYEFNVGPTAGAFTSMVVSKQ